MSETRMFDEDQGSDLGKLVRDALGESVRPFKPGDPSRMRSAEELDAEADAEAEEAKKDALYNPLTQAWPSWSDEDDEEPGHNPTSNS